ncbi:hypothetical protein TBK1r_39560 [Stieleria magnilauensis]|uniref:Uncharacterized protein n=1 Tax=Stieleria magnilauensis TaxID=2527963 RepID=A0ABX5XSN1_9BACT|nr:hypothetical protein TBK1r_39560 [Planctomycetes bacterium TBK1r]
MRSLVSFTGERIGYAPPFFYARSMHLPTQSPRALAADSRDSARALPPLRGPPPVRAPPAAAATRGPPTRRGRSPPRHAPIAPAACHAIPLRIDVDNSRASPTICGILEKLSREFCGGDPGAIGPKIRPLSGVRCSRVSDHAFSRGCWYVLQARERTGLHRIKIPYFFAPRQNRIAASESPKASYWKEGHREWIGHTCWCPGFSRPLSLRSSETNRLKAKHQHSPGHEIESARANARKHRLGKRGIAIGTGIRVGVQASAAHSRCIAARRIA